MAIDNNENRLENNLAWYLIGGFVVLSIFGFSSYLILLRTLFTISSGLHTSAYIAVLLIVIICSLIIYFYCRKWKKNKNLPVSRMYVNTIVVGTIVASIIVYVGIIIGKTSTLFEIINIRLTLVIYLIAINSTNASIFFSYITKPLLKNGFRKDLYLPLSHRFLPAILASFILALTLIRATHYRAEVDFDKEYYTVKIVSERGFIAQELNFRTMSVIDVSKRIGRIVGSYKPVIGLNSVANYEENIGEFLRNTYLEDTNFVSCSVYLDSQRIINPTSETTDSIYTTWYFFSGEPTQTSYNAQMTIPPNIYNRVVELNESIVVVDENTEPTVLVYSPIVINNAVRGVVILGVQRYLIESVFNAADRNKNINTMILDSNYKIGYLKSENIDNKDFLQNSINNNIDWAVIKNTPYNNINNNIKNSDIIDIKNANYSGIKYAISGGLTVLDIWDTKSIGIVENDFIFAKTVINSTIITFTSMIVLFAIFYIFIRDLRRTLVSAKDVALSLSKGAGDLTVRLPIEHGDETGELVDSFNKFLDKMQNIITNVKNNAYTLTGNVQNMRASITVSLSDFQSIAKEFENELQTVSKISTFSTNAARVSFMQRTRFSSVSDTIQSLLENISVVTEHMKTQSEAVSRTSTSIHQMMANIVTVGQGANNANKYAKILLVEAQDSSAIGEAVMESIHGIKEYSKQITSITRVIQNIAEQTNLLAMNAAIEAAHAGEQGRGFTVVADKIRKLAEDTGENSKIINEIIQETTESIDATVSLSLRSTSSLERIVEGTNNLAVLISTISGANDELDIGRRDILHNIKDLNTTTETVQELSDKQRQMSSTVGQNITNVDKLAEDVLRAVNTTEQEMRNLVESIETVSKLSTTSSSNMETLEVRIKDLQTIFVELYKLVTLFKTERTRDDIKKESQNKKIDKDKIKLEKKAAKMRIKEAKKRDRIEKNSKTEI